MASVVQICNSALNQLGASSITALTENSKNARICNERYETIRDAVYRSHPWNCLVKRVQLAHCLRVLQIKDYNSDYKIEGRKLLIEQSSVYLIYLAIETDVNQLDILLRETISAALAQDMAYAITSNLQVAKLMAEKYQAKLSEARHTDASEGYNTDPTLAPTDQIITEDFINSRY